MEESRARRRIIWTARTLGRVNELSPGRWRASDGSECLRDVQGHAIIQRLLEERANTKPGSRV